MTTAAGSAFGPRPADAQAVNRAIGWSVAVHLVLLATVVLVPRDWFARREEPRTVMTINLGGTAGPRSTGTNSLGGRRVEQVAPTQKRPEPPRSTGTNSLGGRRVEQVAPTPKRPEPVRPARPQPPAPAPARATVRPVSKAPAPAPLTPVARPATTGPRVVDGSAAADTRAQGTSTGLSFGGIGNGGEAVPSDFCCPAYLETVLGTIDSNWRKTAGDRGGTTKLRFTIQRNGRIDLANVLVEKSSGSAVLDRAARSALISSDGRLLPLPKEYTESTLIVHLDFPYGL